MTCGLLGGLPLHAALLPGPDGAPAPDRYALDQYAANARSMTSASAVRERLTAGSCCRRISLSGSDATSDAVLRALGQADVLHASCCYLLLEVGRGANR